MRGKARVGAGVVGQRQELAILHKGAYTPALKRLLMPTRVTPGSFSLDGLRRVGPTQERQR